MKKNVIFRIAAIVLMCTLVTACFASSTFAKYTSTTNANQNTVTVAKWDILYDDDQIAIQPAATVEFNVFETILDTETINKGNSDTDVKTGLIAPGVYGSFDIAKITNNSEVTARIGVKITNVANTSNIPLKFYSDAAMTQDITEQIATGNYIVNLQNVAKEGGEIAAKTVYWQWKYEDNRDAADTGLGIAGQTTAPTYTITLQLEATQVD